MNLPLETQRFRLRDFVESDWLAVHQYASDREVCVISHSQTMTKEQVNAKTTLSRLV